MCFTLLIMLWIAAALCQILLTFAVFLPSLMATSWTADQFLPVKFMLT